jgi:NADPH2:quinone reductase
VKAIRIDAPGDPSVLCVTDIDRPSPPPGDELVEVAYAGVNFADIALRRGELKIPLPCVPGLEGAGHTEDGTPVSWAPVLGAAALGSYAQYVSVPAAQLLPLPDDIPLRTAAAVTLQGLTACYLAQDVVAVGPGVTVLVHAAAGGTGSLTVQWLKRLGATVIGVVSSRTKAAVALECGADHVIVGSFVKETLRLTGGRGVDYIIDGVGATFRDDLAAVRTRGTICVFGQAGGFPQAFNPLELMARSVAVRGGYLVNFLRDRDEVLGKADAVWDGVRNGWLKPPTVREFGLEGASGAHSLLESRGSTGKLLLRVR